MKMILKIISVIATGFILVGLFIFGGAILHEGYCVVHPGIDTKYSEQYDEAKFNEIELSMDTSDVIKLIGQPLLKKGTSVQGWYYTAGGKCKWNDFAWLGRHLVIDRFGKVKTIVKDVRYYHNKSKQE